MPNNTRRAKRRANILAAKEARKVAGVNMFTPLNGTEPVVRVAQVNINSSPLGAMAYHGTTPLRAPNLFTGKSFARSLSPQQIKEIQLLGLPVHDQQYLTEEERQTLAAITAENAANIQASKSASEPNAIGLEGKDYLYTTVYPKTPSNFNNNADHRRLQLDETHNVPSARPVKDLAYKFRYGNKIDESIARQLLKRAKEIEAAEGYVVAKPTARSRASAEAYRKYAEDHYASELPVQPSQPVQLRPGQSSRGFFGKLFNSCFGESCSVNEGAVQPLTVVNPLSSVGHGGRSRKRKLRKSRNKRRSRKY
jgi:hypothetical protein